MKKIITLFTLFIGITSNAQYIDHYSYDIQANVSFNFMMDIDNNRRVVDIAKNLTGIQYEVAAYVKKGFASNNSFGVVFDFMNGSSSSETLYISDDKSIDVKSKSSYFFIGPSYKFTRTSFLGSRTSSLSITPGIGLYDTNLSGIGISNSLKSTGIGILFKGDYAYRIYEPLFFVYSIELSAHYFDKFSSDLPKPYSFRGDINESAALFGGKISLGFRYKL